MAQPTPDAEQVIRDYTQMWNDHDPAKIPDLVSDSFVVSNATLPEGTAHGPDGLEDWMRQVTAGFPDFHVEIDELLSQGETVMAAVTYTMTHEGEFGGIPPTGREIELPGMARFRVADGTVREHRDYVDRQDLFEQLGITED